MCRRMERFLKGLSIMTIDMAMEYKVGRMEPIKMEPGLMIVDMDKERV